MVTTSKRGRQTEGKHNSENERNGQTDIEDQTDTHTHTPPTHTHTDSCGREQIALA